LSATFNRSGEPPWLKEWQRKKRLGIYTGPVAHLRYGKFSRAVARSLELERPPLSELDAAELERLEGRL
jgi:hypothetical protein